MGFGGFHHNDVGVSSLDALLTVKQALLVGRALARFDLTLNRKALSRPRTMPRPFPAPIAPNPGLVIGRVGTSLRQIVKRVCA